MSSSWSSLKERGNACFKGRAFAEARDCYEQALAAMQTTEGTPTDRAILESNLSAAHFQLGAFSASVAAADRALVADSAFLKARLRKAHALESLALTETQRGDAATRLRVERLQEAAAIVHKIRQIMTSSAAPSTATGGAVATPAASGLPNLSEVNTTLQRLRKSLTDLHASLSSPITFLSALHGGDSETAASDIRSLMQLVVSSGSARSVAYEAGLADVMLRFILDDDVSQRTRAAAARAMRHVLSSDMSGASSSQLDLSPLRENAPRLLTLLATLHSRQTDLLAEVPPPLPRASAAIAGLIAALVALLARVASHPRLDHAFVRPVSDALAGLLTQSTSSSRVHSPGVTRVALACVEAVAFIGSVTGLPSGDLTHLRRSWLPVLLLGPLATVAHEARADSAHRLRSVVLACVAVLTKSGHAQSGVPAASSTAPFHALARALGQTPPRTEDLSEEQKKALEAEGIAMREEALTLFHAPLVGGAGPASAATPSGGLHFPTALAVVRGLALLLQANAQLGAFVITYGESREPPTKDAQPVAATPPKPTVLQILLALSSYISPSFLTSGGAGSLGVGVSGVGVAAPPRALQLAAAEVLALASTDSLIRSTVAELARAADPVDEELIAEGVVEPGARGAHVFLDLVLEYADQPSEAESSPENDHDAHTSSNETIVAHAILALSKLIAVGEWGETDDKIVTPAADGSDEAPVVDATLRPESAQEFTVLLHVLTRMIAKYERDVPRGDRETELESRAQARKDRRAAAAAAARASGEEDMVDDDDDEESESILAESRQLHRLALLQLCFESLSYASLHSFTKQWITVDDQSHALKLLVRIATGTPSPSTVRVASIGGPVRDAMLRYALVHIFKNIATSRVSLLEGGGGGDAEVDALKKMASRGLTKDAASGAAANEAQEQRRRAIAGSPELVEALTRVLARESGVKALADLFKGYTLHAQDIAEAKKGSSDTTVADASTAAPISGAIALSLTFTLLRIASVRENRGLLVQQGGVRLLLDLYAASPKPPSPLLGTSSSGPATSSDDVSGEVSLNSSRSPYRVSQDALASLARTLISTNPHLVPEVLLAPAAFALLEGLEVAEHELFVFETLLALTNLAAFRPASDDPNAIDMTEVICSGSRKVQVKSRPRGTDEPTTTTVQLNGWTLAKAQLASTNTRVQCAAVELLANLSSASSVRTRLRAVPAEIDAAGGAKVTREAHEASLKATWRSSLGTDGGGAHEDLRLLLAFALSDDVPTQTAATGALAMISADPLIAARLADTRVVSYVPLDAAPEAGEDAGLAELEDESSAVHPPVGSRALIRTGRSIVRRLRTDPTTDPDVRVRIDVLQTNIEQADKIKTAMNK